MTMSEIEKLASLIERLGNLLRSEERAAGAEYGLQPVHVQVLRYISDANRYSDTPAAVTEYLGATKGTTSQSINVLEKKGLIIKRTDRADKRVIHLSVTASGRKLLEKIFPPSGFAASLAGLKNTDKDDLSRALSELLVLLQKQNGGRAFGVCHTCRYFRRDALPSTHQCGLTLEPLTGEDSTKICREHEAAA